MLAGDTDDWDRTQTSQDVFIAKPRNFHFLIGRSLGLAWAAGRRKSNKDTGDKMILDPSEHLQWLEALWSRSWAETEVPEQQMLMILGPRWPNAPQSWRRGNFPLHCMASGILDSVALGASENNGFGLAIGLPVMVKAVVLPQWAEAVPKCLEEIDNKCTSEPKEKNHEDTSQRLFWQRPHDWGCKRALIWNLRSVNNI